MLVIENARADSVRTLILRRDLLPLLLGVCANGRLVRIFAVPWPLDLVLLDTGLLLVLV